MNKEKLLGETLLTRDGKAMKILTIEGDDLEHLIIHTSNKKMFLLFKGLKNGFLRFRNETLNQLFEEPIERAKREDEALLLEKRMNIKAIDIKKMRRKAYRERAKKAREEKLLEMEKKMHSA